MMKCEERNWVYVGGVTMFENPLSDALYYKGVKDYSFDKDYKGFDELIETLRDKRTINYYYA